MIEKPRAFRRKTLFKSGFVSSDERNQKILKFVQRTALIVSRNKITGSKQRVRRNLPDLLSDHHDLCTEDFNDTRPRQFSSGLQGFLQCRLANDQVVDLCLSQGSGKNGFKLQQCCFQRPVVRVIGAAFIKSVDDRLLLIVCMNERFDHHDSVQHLKSCLATLKKLCDIPNQLTCILDLVNIRNYG